LAENISLPFDTVKALVHKGLIDKAYLKRLKEIQDSDGNPEKMIQKDLMGAGAEDENKKGSSHHESFNSLAASLNETINYLINEDIDEIEEIEKDLLLELETMIQQLKAKANMTDE